MKRCKSLQVVLLRRLALLQAAKWAALGQPRANQREPKRTVVEPGVSGLGHDESVERYVSVAVAVRRDRNHPISVSITSVGVQVVTLDRLD